MKKLIYADDLKMAIRDDANINGYNFAIIKQHIEEAEPVAGIYLMKEEYEKLLEYKHMYEDLCQ